jgi:hypothetical protein
MLYQTWKGTELVPGASPYWIGSIILDNTATCEEVAAAVAKKMRLAASDVLYIYVKTGEAVREILQTGRNVNLDWVAFTIALTGSFEKANSPFTPGQNALMVRAHARPALRDCLAGITPRNVTNGLKAAIQSVVDGAAQAEGVITVSTVYVSGVNILVNPANADEGCWLVAKDGTIAATPAIVANDAATMDLSFAALPPNGEFTLVVKARSGASTDFAPAVARRNVIVNAS